MKKNELAVIPVLAIEQHILLIRGQKVILDSDLGRLYGVPTKRFNEQIKRNKLRFPNDFMFQLTKEEFVPLRSQFATSNSRGGTRYLPYVFTEHGAIMAASVLNSDQAIQASLFVVRAFVKMREMLSTQKQLAQKLAELESRLDGHDSDIQTLVAAIRQLAEPLKEHKGRRLGFKRPEGAVLKQETKK